MEKKKENEIKEINQSDWFLESLVKMINGTDAALPITLSTGGFLVSGLLISGHKYFEQFATDIGQMITDQEERESIKKNFLNLGNLYSKEKLDNDTAPPQFFHLSDSKYYHPNGRPIPNDNSMYYRGRITKVNGFHIGTLVATER